MVHHGEVGWYGEVYLVGGDCYYDRLSLMRRMTARVLYSPQHAQGVYRAHLNSPVPVQVRCKVKECRSSNQAGYKMLVLKDFQEAKIANTFFFFSSQVHRTGIFFEHLWRKYRLLVLRPTTLAHFPKRTRGTAQRQNSSMVYTLGLHLNMRQTSGNSIMPVTSNQEAVHLYNVDWSTRKLALLWQSYFILG